MTIQFQPAVKTTRKLRLAFVSYEGGGKTYSSLNVAKFLARPRENGAGGTALIDTEGGSAAIYADRFAFDTLRLEQHSPESYVAALEAAEKAGYDVVIIDSLSHEWMGAGGTLEIVDSLKAGGGFGWDKATPRHRKVFDAIVGSPVHVIVTLRQKKAYIEEVGPGGKKRMREIGTEAIQREGAEYEFDVIGILDRDNNTMAVSKSRIQTVPQGTAIAKPGEDFAKKLLADLNSGVAPSDAPPPTVVTAPPAPAAPTPAAAAPRAPATPAAPPPPPAAPENVLPDVQALIVRTHANLKVGDAASAEARNAKAGAFRVAMNEAGLKNWSELWSKATPEQFKKAALSLGLRVLGNYIATDEPEQIPLAAAPAADGFDTPDGFDAGLAAEALAAPSIVRPPEPVAPTLPAPQSPEDVVALPWRTETVGDTYFVVEREPGEKPRFVIFKVREAFGEKVAMDRKRDVAKAITTAKKWAEGLKVVGKPK